MRIGVYLGSFNPIHQGHLIVADTAIDEFGLDLVEFVVSPKNPFKTNVSDLIDVGFRKEMVALSIMNNFKLSIFEETEDNNPSYSYIVLQKIKLLNPNDELFIICGSDVYKEINLWKEHEWIIDNFSFIIYRRGDENVELLNNNSYLLESDISLDISSTKIRNRIKQNRSIKFLVDKNVEGYIKNKKLWQ